MAKKLLFVGAGAIGSYLGAFMSRAGHDVMLIDPWAEQVEAIRQHGISVTGPHDPFVSRPKATHLNDAQTLPRDYDIAFVAMKVFDTAWATQLALRHLAPHGFVVSSQNCWPDPDRGVDGGRRAVGGAHHVEDRRRHVEARNTSSAAWSAGPARGTTCSGRASTTAASRRA